MNFLKLIIEVPVVGLFLCYWLFLLPAVVITVLKRRRNDFLGGFLTFGFTWYLGAGGEARAGSPWMRRNGESASGYRNAGRAKKAILSPWAAVGVILLVGLFALRPTPILGTDGSSLQHSVGGGTPLPGGDRCKGRPGGDWTCFEYDNVTSGHIHLRTTVDGVGCWKAETAGEGVRDSGEAEESGCVTIFNHLRPFTRLFG